MEHNLARNIIEGAKAVLCGMKMENRCLIIKNRMGGWGKEN